MKKTKGDSRRVGGLIEDELKAAFFGPKRHEPSRAPFSREEIAARANAAEDIGDPAIDCLFRLDAKGFVDYAEGSRGEHGRPQQLRLVDRHVRLLRDLGIFEEALLYAYQANSVSNCNDYPVLSRLLKEADPGRLRAAGQPAPGPGPFTLYRGVAGRENEQHVRGFSWTGSLGVAGSQALALGLPDPAVYRTVVLESCVLAYVLGEEDDYLVGLPPDLRLERVPETEWRLAAARERGEGGVR